MEQAHAAIERAGIAMQMFEVALVSNHEGFKMIIGPAYLQAMGGMIEEGRYDNATAKAPDFDTPAERFHQFVASTG
ncbi:hypothetical protein [Burkholderia ubonensis]|uniref:Uncharacterized protein n=1 Tax=Burkholderia ubonensis subsp. mesacidophila TaxID=265293 RepID=A0A2A4FNI3_9BURK|nr:hypothetical protein [Burkholderia ubonensis]PCE34242.1 hypothetical protein BZL54_01370 [Burkholderia ubonensis subsp. mesacidophila]